jgi:hypothetical protein
MLRSGPQGARLEASLTGVKVLAPRSLPSHQSGAAQTGGISPVIRGSSMRFWTRSTGVKPKRW